MLIQFRPDRPTSCLTASMARRTSTALLRPRWCTRPSDRGARALPTMGRATEAEGTSPCWRSSMAEHLFCKQAVKGSNPLASSQEPIADAARTQREYAMVSEGCPSGQREQTVNLPVSAFSGSNPLPSTARKRSQGMSALAGESARGASERGSSSVGRASAFQAECRRFEPGLPLQNFEQIQRFGSKRPGSSVVEHLLGKEEVVSSILILGSARKRRT
jgi:hypothetical protein